MLKIDSKKYKALLFDFDGTLVDSEPMHYQAISEGLAVYDKKFVSVQEHKKLYRGTSMHYAISKEVERHNLNESLVDELKTIINKNLKKIMEEKGLFPTKGVLELIKKAKNKGIKLAIVSGSLTDFIEYTLDKSKIPNFFDEVIGVDRFIEPKPNPAGFLLAAKLLNVDPSECLVFEDAPNGILAAQNAGMDVIVIGDSLPWNMDSNIAFIKDFTEVTI